MTKRELVKAIKVGIEQNLLSPAVIDELKRVAEEVSINSMRRRHGVQA